MSNLIDCPDCEKRVSPRARACPHCGCPIADLVNPSPQSANHTDADSFVDGLIEKHFAPSAAAEKPQPEDVCASGPEDGSSVDPDGTPPLVPSAWWPATGLGSFVMVALLALAFLAGMYPELSLTGLTNPGRWGHAEFVRLFNGSAAAFSWWLMVAGLRGALFLMTGVRGSSRAPSSRVGFEEVALGAFVLLLLTFVVTLAIVLTSAHL